MVVIIYWFNRSYENVVYYSQEVIVYIFAVSTLSSHLFKRATQAGRVINVREIREEDPTSGQLIQPIQSIRIYNEITQASVNEIVKFTLRFLRRNIRDRKYGSFERRRENRDL